MSLPCNFNSLAKAAMAKVCDVDNLLILSERKWFMKYNFKDGMVIKRKRRL
jgi:hypothetical protein